MLLESNMKFYLLLKNFYCKSRIHTKYVIIIQRGNFIMKKFLVLLSALLISVSMYCSTSEVKTQTNKKVTKIDILEVRYIDVGQGDAALIKCSDLSMLIDGRGDDKGILVQNYIKKQGVPSETWKVGESTKASNIKTTSNKSSVATVTKTETKQQEFCTSC